MVSVAYLTRINFLSDKAHVHTISKTCEALSLVPDISLTLVSTDNSLRNVARQEEFFRVHGVKNRFEVRSLCSVANRFKNSPHFFIYNISTLIANVSLLGYVLRERKNIDCVYFRDHLILPVIWFAKYVLRKRVVYESHYILTKSFGQWLAERSAEVSDAVVAIAIALKEYYLQFNKNIVVSFCASSDKDKFDISKPKEFFRQKTALKNDVFYAVYTGNVDVTGNGDSYGVEDVIQALPLLPLGVTFVAVGKKTNDRHPLEQLADSLGAGSRFICIPWVSRETVVDYILSADVLIIPKSGAKPGNSPTKMFEYLATMRPIVSADTVPMREVLHDGKNCILVDYTKPDAWANAINTFRENLELAQKIVAQAYSDADLYTWEKRGNDIARVIQDLYV